LSPDAAAECATAVAAARKREARIQQVDRGVAVAEQQDSRQQQRAA